MLFLHAYLLLTYKFTFYFIYLFDFIIFFDAAILLYAANT